jgi:hypothetical protein
MRTFKVIFPLLLWAFVAAILTSVVIFILCQHREAELVEVYQKNLRSIFFTGFLTAGSFLLSLKTFVVVKIKEGLIDSREYIQKFSELKKINPDLDLYSPLKQLSEFLFICILSAIVTSFAQISLGFVALPWAVMTCVSMASFTFVSILFALFYIRKNIQTWLDYAGDNKKC